MKTTGKKLLQEPFYWNFIRLSQPLKSNSVQGNEHIYPIFFLRTTKLCKFEWPTLDTVSELNHINWTIVFHFSDVIVCFTKSNYLFSSKFQSKCPGNFFDLSCQHTVYIFKREHKKIVCQYPLQPEQSSPAFPTFNLATEYLIFRIKPRQHTFFLHLKYLFPLFQWHACKLAKLSACITKCMTTISKRYIVFLLHF